ncbi:MAG: tyrosine-type recombinase/integrase [Pseudomonadota bacterium]
MTLLVLDWSEETGEGKWTIARERVKTGRALNVPLSALAVDIIRDAMNDPARPKESQFLFSTKGETPVSEFRKARTRLDRYIDEARAEKVAQIGARHVPMPHWTIHDLRTTFANEAAEILQIDIAVVDRMLDHVATATTSKVARNYNMSELFKQRREASNLSADLLERDVTKRSLQSEKDLSANQYKSGSGGRIFLMNKRRICCSLRYLERDSDEYL